MRLQILWNTAAAAAAAMSLQSCPTLCDPIDGGPPGSPVPGILQATILEWVAISFSNAWKWKVKVKSLSCARLSDPMDCSLPGSSVHGIFRARVLEWGAIAFSLEHYRLQYRHLDLELNCWSLVAMMWACDSTWPASVLSLGYVNFEQNLPNSFGMKRIEGDRTHMQIPH